MTDFLKEVGTTEVARDSLKSVNNAVNNYSLFTATHQNKSPQFLLFDEGF